MDSILPFLNMYLLSSYSECALNVAMDLHETYHRQLFLEEACPSYISEAVAVVTVSVAAVGMTAAVEVAPAVVVAAAVEVAAAAA